MKEKISKIKKLITELNAYSNAYYNSGQSEISDEAYDKMLDELEKLENETGFKLSGSPTRNVGYKAIDKLKKYKHEKPLLSLEKTKEITKVVEFAGERDVMLMLKLDGLTIELIYENGRLIKASTRGDGNIGTDITHNMQAFKNVPLEISYKNRLVVVGEGIIHTDDFEKMKNTKTDAKGEHYKNARNLAAGSVKLLDTKECSQRQLYFIAFRVSEGLEELVENKNSKAERLKKLSEYGFERCSFSTSCGGVGLEIAERKIKKLREIADKKHIPIDGIVISFDDIDHSEKCGYTEKYYKDGLAYKFQDNLVESKITNIEWQVGRTGLITPVAIFKPVEIEGSTVSRASLNNVSFLRRKKINIGCRVLISKRNMIIPYIEENLDKDLGCAKTPKQCPCCGGETKVRVTTDKSGKEIKKLYCVSDTCIAKNLNAIVHFASKDVMDIEGLAESTIERFVSAGIIKSPVDIYSIPKYKKYIIGMDGFGEISYNNLADSIEKSRHTTLDKFLMAMNIKNLGRTASRAISDYFGGNIEEFEQAVYEKFTFNIIDGIGAVLNFEIYKWFTVKDEKGREKDNCDNWAFWYDLKECMEFEKKTLTAVNIFTGKNIVVTGTLENFTRAEIMQKIEMLGGFARSSVSAKTDYLIVGSKPGSKLNAARENGVVVLTEAQFLSMVA